MLIRRCAWHPQYRGRRLVYGVTSWRSHELRFTDGICRRCSDRVRAELGFPALRLRAVRRVSSRLRVVVPAGLACLAVMGAVYAARHDRGA